MKGSIKERSPGHWAIILEQREAATGKRKRKWHSFKGTKRQAQIECARLISEMKGGTYLPTPVAYQGALYALSETGILARLDAKDGTITYRSRLDTDAGSFTSSPWAYNGKIFCLNEEGKTFVVAAGEKFELLHVNLLDEMAQATPAIVGDRLLLRTESRLYSIRQVAK